jgi:alcohol dehydrogenase (cytochrome c)
MPLGALVAVLAVGACGGADHSTRDASEEWAAPNGDVANHRRVEGPIDAASVARLRVAWRVPLSAEFAATPIVVDGVVYTQDLQSNVSAIDLDSGKVLWTRTYEVGDTGPNGVNVVDGRVLGATPTDVFALETETGRVLWSTTIARHTGDLIDMAPGYHDGAVFVSTAVAGDGAVGTLWALDAQTGRARWRWQMVPTDLWGDPRGNSGGGLWHPPAFDGQGSLYVSTGNPLPFPGRPGRPWGGTRPGPNRWTNSIVKLDERSGRIVWARQVLPHDIYDWDLEGPVILDRVDGRLLAITAGKMGFVYAFDAIDGELRWKRSVGVHNGHDRDNLLALRGDFHPRPPMTVLPGWWGGVETQMASDGRVVYVPVNNLATVYSSGSRLEPPDPSEGTGELVALDLATGAPRWDRRLPASPYGAATISSDLVFTTTLDGTVWALRRSDGDVAWRTGLPAGTNSPVAIAGDTLIAAAGVPRGPEDQPQLVAYRLGGGDT